MGLSIDENVDSVTKEKSKQGLKMLEKRKRKLFLNEYISLTGFNRKYAITKINSCIKRKT